jgi:hypothetical protein
MIEQSVNLKFTTDTLWEGNFNDGIVSGYTEAYYTQINPNTYEFRVRSTKEIEKVIWHIQGDEIEGFSIGKTFTGVPSTVSVDVYYYHESVETITLSLLTPRDTSTIGGILKVNGASQTWIANAPLSSIESIQNIKVDIESGVTRPLLSGKSYEIYKPQLILKLVEQPTELSTINVNGFIFTFSNDELLVENSPVHVLIGKSVNETIENLVHRISLTYDPRLKKNQLCYLAEYNELRIYSDELDVSLFNYTVSSSFSGWVGDGTMRGMWLDVEYSFVLDPMLPVWNDIDTLPAQSDSFQKYHLAVRTTRRSNIEYEWLWVKNIYLDGTWCTPRYEGDKIAEFTYIGQKIVFSPNDNYKIEKIDGIFVKATGINAPERDLKIQYRYSFTNGRQWSSWMNLTVGSICSVNVNPIGFFKIEYMVERIGTDSTGVIELYDITLTGELINVTCDYAKQNYLGINIDCYRNLAGTGSQSVGVTGNGLNNCKDINQEFEESLTAACDTGTLFNPYKLDEIAALYERRSSEMNKVLGRGVTYFRTAADPSGIDYVLHEQQLFERYEHRDIKILVPNNEYPNLFQGFGLDDLLLQDKFEVHILKSEFKRFFGITARPRRNDSIYFCDVNLIYDVLEAQEAREVANFSVYYKVMLGKHLDKKNVRNVAGSSTEDLIKSLTDTKKIENVLEPIHKKEEERVLKKEQLKPQSEPTWKISRAKTVKVNAGNIIVGSNTIARYHYDLSQVEDTDFAVEYDNMANVLTECDSTSISIWTQLLALSSDEQIIMDNQNKGQGWQLSILNRTVRFRVNSQIYDLPSKDIQAGSWFCVIASIDNIQGEVKLSVWVRTSSDIVHSTRKKWSDTYITYNHDEKCLIPGGFDLKVTQIRVWNDSISDSDEKSILLQPIAIDSNRLIIVDNCEPQINLPSMGSDRNRY